MRPPPIFHRDLIIDLMVCCAIVWLCGGRIRHVGCVQMAQRSRRRGPTTLRAQRVRANWGDCFSSLPEEPAAHRHPLFWRVVWRPLCYHVSLLRFSPNAGDLLCEGLVARPCARRLRPRCSARLARTRRRRGGGRRGRAYRRSCRRSSLDERVPL